MKYFYAFLFAGLFFIKSSNGQNITVNEVTDKVNWRVGSSSILKQDAGFVSLTYEGKWASAFGSGFISGDCVIRRYDTGLMEKQSSTVRLENLTTDAALFQLALLNKRLYIIYTSKSDDREHIDVKCLELDTTTLKPLQESKIATYERTFNSEVSFTVSPGKQLGLLKTRNMKKKVETIRFSIIGANAKSLRNIDYTLEETLYLREAVVNDSGAVYVLMEDKADKKMSNCYLEYYAMNAKSKPQKQVLDLGDNYLKYYNMYFNRINNKCFLFGTYSIKRDGSSTGTFMLELTDGKKKKVKPYSRDFDNDLLTIMEKDGCAKNSGKNMGLVHGFGPMKIHTRSDGSMDYVLECNSATSLSRSTMFESLSILDIHYKNGQCTFVRVPKAQRYANMNTYLSNFSFTYDDKLVFLYNEREDNMQKPLELRANTMVTPKSSVLVASIIDQDNGLTRKIVWDNGEGRYASQLLSFVGLADNKVLVVQSKVGLTNLTYRLGLMDIE